jgi:hypothetical protein
MDEAAPQAAKGAADFERDLGAVSHGLAALRAAWGDVFLFGHDERGYWAAPPSAGKGWMCADTPEELGNQCADFMEAEAASAAGAEAGAGPS